MKRIAFLSFLLIPLLHTIVNGQTWAPTSYEISFKIKNAGFTVTGRFTALKSTLVFSADKLASSSLKASVDATTIKTGIDKRDENVKDEYLNADKYKTIEVASTRLYKKGTQYAGMFNVTIKGTTKQIEIPFNFKETGDQATFTGSFPLSRKGFGIGGKTLTMSDDLTVNIMLKAKK